ncbi:MAG: ankyrin repeat domain-containing protein [Rubrivivax sp.]
MSTRRQWLVTALAAGCASTPALVRAGAYEDYLKAIELDDAGAMRTLLARGVDPDTRDAQGQVGLYVALRNGARRVVEVLLQHPQTDVEATNAANETPLMMAALRADIASMKALLARGARVRREGWTPLHYAASSPSVEPVRLLLDQGAEVDARAPNGNTPLMLAARWGHEDSVDLLLARGADRRLRNARGQDAVDYARLDGRETSVRRLEAAGR